MVGVVIIAVLFVALAVLVAAGASRGSFGGLGKALQTTNRSGSRLFNSSMIFVYLAGIIVVPAIFIIGNRDNSNAQVHGVRLTAAMQSGRELFAEHCAVCHTLAADNAVGKIGPNLDQVRPSEALIMKTVTNGCLQKPTAASVHSTCLGYGNMPADIVQGRQAQDIAAFVAAIAGRP
ncbi:MAG: c-type cytochrome [Solirubrobacteraceae bacterium]